MQSKETANHKRIAKNAVVLYIRMFFVLLVTLYTSRKMLSVLGFDDYGIYNVVAGVVVLSSFLTTAMTSASQRFISCSLGEGGDSTNDVFSSALNLHFFLGLIIIILLETLGLWFVNTKLVIPEGRESAAIWTFHISVLITFLTFVRAPFVALVISYEKMGIMAVLSIAETVLKLAVILLTPVFHFDNLIIYSLLLLLATLLINVAYIIINRQIIPVRFKFGFNRSLFRSMLSFSWWSLFGGIGNVFRGQGVNMLFNMFFGVIANAAMGISNQVSQAVNMFMTNFTLAFNPQIVKLYAANQKEEFFKLVSSASKYSFLLMSFMTIPLVCCMNSILKLWLGDYPAYANFFCICAVLSIVVDSMSAALWTAIGATGKIKSYQITMFAISVAVFPVSYVLLFLGFPPHACLLCNVIANLLMLLSRVYFLKKNTGFAWLAYVKNIFCRGFLLYFFSCVITYLSSRSFQGGISHVIITVSISLMMNTLIFGFLFLNKSERNFVKQMFLSKISGKSLS